MINLNFLPVVVDMTEDASNGTYTGLYDLFSILAAVFGPNINGWMIHLSGKNYSLTMLMGPIFMFLAFVMIAGVGRGEASGIGCI